MRLAVFVSVAVLMPVSALVAMSGSGEVIAEPVDDGRALVNPGMGWVMHYYDNSERYRIGCMQVY